jgi:hypothetical protein
VVRAILPVWPAVWSNQRGPPNCLHDAEPAWVEALCQLGSQHHLVEDVPVIVHVLRGVSKVRSSSVAPGIAEVAPHWIVEEWILPTLDRASYGRCHSARHHRTQVASQSSLKRIHIEIANQCDLLHALRSRYSWRVRRTPSPGSPLTNAVYWAGVRQSGALACGQAASAWLWKFVQSLAPYEGTLRESE